MIYLVDTQHDASQHAYTFFALKMASSAGYEHLRLAKIICLTEAVIDPDTNGSDDLPVVRPHGSPRRLSGQGAALPMSPERRALPRPIPEPFRHHAEAALGAPNTLQAGLRQTTIVRSVTLDDGHDVAGTIRRRDV